MYTLDYLLSHSNLPGPRGNLELLYAFAENAEPGIIGECLQCIKPDTANSPEEFVGMCGVLGYAVAHKADNAGTIAFLNPYASHSSWRIREAVAMGIQAIAAGALEKTLVNISPMTAGNGYERRAVVAGLCEPKLLGRADETVKVLKILESITRTLDHDKKLTDDEEALRKGLGYGWSVAIAASPEDGKRYFEALFSLSGKHIQWIIRENLKKNRLSKMDNVWVGRCAERLNV